MTKPYHPGDLVRWTSLNPALPTNYQHWGFITRTLSFGSAGAGGKEFELGTNLTVRSLHTRERFDLKASQITAVHRRHAAARLLSGTPA